MGPTVANWTHSSVVKLPEHSNPVEFVVRKARAVTLHAIEQGWTGPPFDPIQLARLLGINVEPREGIVDARTVPAGRGRVRIEYNPDRPRGRMRFSIAHEIAHTFFPDCADQVRLRADKSTMQADDWQLEMLCNIGAAELIMPLGSFPDLGSHAVCINELMELRRQYDVSIEALLLRFIHLTRVPCALFAASRVEDGPYDGRYRVDYAIASPEWRDALPVGMHLSDNSIVQDCTAIGFTAKGQDKWGPEQVFHVECVGVPPYPGKTFPRVLGLAALPDNEGPERANLTYLYGNALKPRGKGPRIIAQIVNDKALTWGGGFARQAARHYAAAQVDYRQWAQSTGSARLGHTHFYGSPSGIEIASMVAQQGFGPSKEPRIRYPALQECLATVATRAHSHAASVHMPRIGCGLAGGRWDVVSELIDQSLVRNNVQVTVYDLPPRGKSRR